MNTYLTITVGVSPMDAIQCVYKTLISFEHVNDSYLKENILTAYANINYKIMYNGKPSSGKLGSKLEIACLITIPTYSNNSCSIAITVNTAGIADVGNTMVGKTHEFAADFLKRFSEALEENNT